MTQRELQVGDRVRIVKKSYSCTEVHVGKTGKITGRGSSECAWAVLPEGDGFFGLIHHESALELIPAPSPLSITLPGDPPTSISINGVTYVAQAEAAEEEKPECPEVAVGQIWKRKSGGFYYHATHNSGVGATIRLHALEGGWCYSPDATFGLSGREAWEFVAPSLKAALTSGKLKPEDL